MTPENFCYWLQGWFELNTTIDHREGASKETLAMIGKHLDSVFDAKIMKENPKTVAPIPVEVAKKIIFDTLKEKQEYIPKFPQTLDEALDK